MKCAVYMSPRECLTDSLYCITLPRFLFAVIAFRFFIKFNFIFNLVTSFQRQYSGIGRMYFPELIMYRRFILQISKLKLISQIQCMCLTIRITRSFNVIISLTQLAISASRAFTGYEISFHSFSLNFLFLFRVTSVTNCIESDQFERVFAILWQIMFRNHRC